MSANPSVDYNKAWSCVEEEFLRSNYLTMTAEEIHEKIGRSKNAVHARAMKLGLKKKRECKGYDDKIRCMAKDGYTITEIARRINFHHSTVRDYLKDNDIQVKCGVEYHENKAMDDDIEGNVSNWDNVDFKKITVADWYKYWYQTYRNKDIKETTKKKYRVGYSHIRKRALGDKKLSVVTRGDIQNYISEYGENLSKQTVFDHMQTLRSCFKDAVLDGHIKTNPAMNVKPIYKELKLNVMELKELREEKKWLEVDEYQKLKYYLVFWLQRELENEPIFMRNKSSGISVQIYYMIIFVALKTGARFAEILGLTQDDILETSELNIDKTWDYKGHEGGKFKETKNISSIRKIMVDKETIDLLNKYMKWLDKKGYVMEEETLFMVNAYRTHSSVVNDQLVRLLKGLDIEPITIHKLRHTQASYLIAKGVPLQVVAKRLGHTDTNMIQRVYGHLLQETEERGNKMILGLI